MADSSFQIDIVNRSWIINATAVNATATATAPAVAGKCNAIISINLSASGAITTAATATLTFGASTKAIWEIPTGTMFPINIYLSDYGILDTTINQTISVALTALGTGVTGSVTITGYYTDAPY